MLGFVKQAMKAIRALLKRPLPNLQTMFFTGFPFLRIADKGLADIKTNPLVSLLDQVLEGIALSPSISRRLTS